MIDLHTHSTASDGAYPPEKLVEKALAMGLKALALTDHDTLAGVERARSRAEGSGMLFLPGVEIEIEIPSGEFHLLGLALIGDCSGLVSALGRIQAARRDRNLRMVEKLQGAGYAVTMAELKEIAGEEIVSRAHFARLLVKKRVVSSIDAAFKRFIGKGMPFYEPRACLPLREAASLIRAAGGVAVVAHPVSLGLRGPALRTHMQACRDQGVTGIEAWHPNHALKDCRRLERLAQSLDMLVTGGSDFHGEYIPRRKLGFTLEGREVPDSVLDALLEACGRVPLAAGPADGAPGGWSSGSPGASSSLHPPKA